MDTPASQSSLGSTGQQAPRPTLVRRLLTPIALAAFWLLTAAPPDCGGNTKPDPSPSTLKQPDLGSVDPVTASPSCPAGQVLCQQVCTATATLRTEERCGSCSNSCVQSKSECIETSGSFSCSNQQLWGIHPTFRSDSSAINLRAVFGVGSGFAIFGGESLSAASSTDFFTSFTLIRDTTGLTGTIQAIWGTSADQIYAAGTNGVVLKLKADSGKWMNISEGPSLGDLSAIWGDGNGTIYVGGTAGLWSYKEPSSSWQTSIPRTETVRAIWGPPPGASSNMVYAISDRSLFSERIGSGLPWTPVLTLPTDFHPMALWGQGQDYLIAVGKGGQICEGPVSQLSCKTVIDQDLLGVFGIGDPVSSMTVYAVGRKGTLIKRQAVGGWVSLQSGTSEDLYSIWGSDARHFLAVGAKHTVIARSPNLNFRQGPPASLRPRR